MPAGLDCQRSLGCGNGAHDHPEAVAQHAAQWHAPELADTNGRFTANRRGTSARIEAWTIIGDDPASVDLPQRDLGAGIERVVDELAQDDLRADRAG